MKKTYRALLVVSSIGLVAFCSWRGIGNMFEGFWLALIVVGIGDLLNLVEDTHKPKAEIKEQRHGT